jgi:hypothetical protein
MKGEQVKESDRVEEIRLSDAVRSDETRERTQTNVKIQKVLETFDL